MHDERDKYSGLHSRDYGLAQLERAIGEAKQRGQIVGVLFTDFDNYHGWNYKYGHGCGDIMLRQLADMVQSVVGEKGVACRYGGDEFLIVLPATSVGEAKAIAEKICNESEQMKVKVKEQEVPSVTMTIGLAFYPEHGEDVLSLLIAADETVMQGKEKGRNRVYTA